ncbi:isoprenyl transferase [Piscirickettsia salmonis]|uniref:isoprenyl transferase n=1 Tax=Piscirickettsia salmonis TaxID=1238 RepID=UPI0007C925DD
MSSMSVEAEAALAPKHIAIIMDGNGRWATARKLPRAAGHRAGAEAVRRIVKASAERGIEALTLFAFSSENWNRPEREVKLIMELFSWTVNRELKRLQNANIRLEFIGDLSALSDKLRTKLLTAAKKTASNTGMKLVVAVNYGGRWDIAHAAQKIAAAVKGGDLSTEEINEQMLSEYLSTSHLPDPDLFIRTSGELRISNFLMWQLAYTELYFADVHWPDFDETELDKAIADFSNRQRRFGKTPEQINE